MPPGCGCSLAELPTSTLLHADGVALEGSDASIPTEDISTVAQRRAFLNTSVLGHLGIWRIIASFI